MTKSEACPASLRPKSRLDAADINAIIAGTHGRPAQVLGCHTHCEGLRIVHAVRTFRPQEQEVWILDLATGQRRPAQCMHKEGFFECLWYSEAEAVKSPAYRLQLLGNDGGLHEIEDPYRFGPHITAYDHFLFGEGNLAQSWRILGAHSRLVDEVQGIHFAVWAPNARRVSVIGPFNSWDERVHPMHMYQSGVWELFIPNLVAGEFYKYSLLSLQGNYHIDKMDPHGFLAEVRPGTSSRIWYLEEYHWKDEEWLIGRSQQQVRSSPLSIYEVHLGSWKRSLEDGSVLSYRDLAPQLVAYCQQMGYTHIELMPIMEHPLDQSWGYQVTGYFAPTSRFGTPDDFRFLVDTCHQGGIGVLLDWVPAHFPKDGHGLAFFDGTHLYEHEDPRQGEHRGWGTRIFNFGRNEVRNFLISNALFWLEEYHIDGFRVDAVASMLYLDYDRREDEWLANPYGGRENIEAIAFLREFNRVVHTAHPGVITIAEESTSWPLVTYPDYVEGLGFDFKWNMGWMHDTLEYFALDPIYRKTHQNLITFGMMYAHSENFILAFSHDEVVHLKKSQLQKMPGDRWQQLANLRLLATYQYGHPGKVLNFMGNEFAQIAEWSEARSLDWHLLEEPSHQQFQAYMRDLGQLYLQLPALWLKDNDENGFSWIDFRDLDNTTVSFARYGEYPEDTVVVILNMTPVPRPGYQLGVPGSGAWLEILNSDQPCYGGGGIVNPNPLWTREEPMHGFDHMLTLNLPPLGGIMLSRRIPADFVPTVAD